MASNVEIVEDLQDRLLAGIEDSLSQLSACMSGDDALAKELEQKFGEAVADISRVKFVAVGPGNGSFFVKGGDLQVAEGPVSKLLYAVIDDLKFGKKNPALDFDELIGLFNKVIRGYVFHELRHRTQGLELYERVGDVRATGGNMVMAQIDAQADRDAAVAAAAVDGFSNREQFLNAFQEALFLSTAYYFRVFPIPTNRPDKVARALGVLLMLARLAASHSPVGFREDSKFPLDAPLFAFLHKDRKLLTIWRGEPQILLGHSNDEGEISELCDDVIAGRFEKAISRCVSLLRRCGIVR